jgi:hypothetical protein|tara:strand:+ start:39 stop:266 length:228 start_codon:yes stop_codon:yes gene_type:complete
MNDKHDALVKRLRLAGNPACWDAADRIEALEAQRDRAVELLRDYVKAQKRCNEECATLDHRDIVKTWLRELGEGG